MIGCDLPSNDEWTTSLLTNPEVISVDQHSTSARPVTTTDKAVVWVSRATSTSLQYLAIFNLSDHTAKLQYSWKDLGFEGSHYKLRDLWERRNLGTANGVMATVPAHGAVLYGISFEQENQGRPQ
jgi:hypothetical protein